MPVCFRGSYICIPSGAGCLPPFSFCPFCSPLIALAAHRLTNLTFALPPSLYAMYNEIEGTALVENVQSGYDALYGQRVTSYDAKIFASAKGPTYQANIITNYTKRPYKKGTWLQVEGRMLQATHSADFDISARELHSLAVSPPPEISPAKIWAYLAIGFRPQNLDDDLELYDPSPYPDPRQVAFG